MYCVTQNVFPLLCFTADFLEVTLSFYLRSWHTGESTMPTMMKLKRNIEAQTFWRILKQSKLGKPQKLKSTWIFAYMHLESILWDKHRVSQRKNVLWQQFQVACFYFSWNWRWDKAGFKKRKLCWALGLKGDSFGLLVQSCFLNV